MGRYKYWLTIVVLCSIAWGKCVSGYYYDSGYGGHRDSGLGYGHHSNGYRRSTSPYDDDNPSIRNPRYSPSDNYNRGYDDRYDAGPNHRRHEYPSNRRGYLPSDQSSAYSARRYSSDSYEIPRHTSSSNYDNNYGSYHAGSPSYQSSSSYHHRPSAHSPRGHSSSSWLNPYVDAYERSRQTPSSSSSLHSYYSSSSSRYPSSSSRYSSSSGHAGGSYDSSPSYHRVTSVHWYQPLSAYRDSYNRNQDKGRGYYQASYDLGQDDYYRYKYPRIPEYDQSYSTHDTSDYYDYKQHKVACYQCNYKPGKTTWRLVTVKKSVPDPYYPFRYMSVNTKQYVRSNGVSAGWDKCQGALTRRSAQLNGVYQDATCEGNCYVRVDKNGMVYRGCYSGEWGVNPHLYGCSHQAGSLYCFCRGDRCNGFLAPNTYSDPYPTGYGERQEYPYPSDYPRSSRYNPYPELQHYHQSHPYVFNGYRHSGRYRRDTSGTNTSPNATDIYFKNSLQVYLKMTGSQSEVDINTRSTVRRSCFVCSGGVACKTSPATNTGTGCSGNCYVRLDVNNGVSRGCYSGEMGINQHLIGCHVQRDATYCFCRPNNCNNFSVSLVKPDVRPTAVKLAKTGTAKKATNIKNPDYPMVLYYVEFAG